MTYIGLQQPRYIPYIYMQAVGHDTSTKVRLSSRPILLAIHARATPTRLGSIAVRAPSRALAGLEARYEARYDRVNS